MDRVSRDTLFDEVWAEPMTVVAKRYRVSGSYMTRVCSELGIPLPGRGHWAEVKAGKARAKPDLHPPSPGSAIEWARDGQPRRAPEAIGALPDRSSTEVHFIKPRKLHPLVASTKSRFEKSWPPKAGYLRPRSGMLPDITVSLARLDEALSLASAIYRSLEERGYKVVIASSRNFRRPRLDTRSTGTARPHCNDREWSPNACTVFQIGDLSIGLSIFECSEQAESRWNAGRREIVSLESKKILASVDHGRLGWFISNHYPSGRFGIRAYSPYPGTEWERKWVESSKESMAVIFRSFITATEKQAVESFPTMIRDAERRAEEERVRREHEHQEWQARVRERELLERADRRDKARQDSLAALDDIVEAWRRGRARMDFLNAAEAELEAMPEPSRMKLAARIETVRAALSTRSVLNELAEWPTPDELDEVREESRRRR